MGNSESQQGEGRPDIREPSEMRRCYYEVLEVERSDSTTTDDIKKVLPFPQNGIWNVIAKCILWI
jgi:hypothetical protein